MAQACMRRGPACIVKAANLYTIFQTIETGKASESLGHILVQLSACLRNIADISGTRNQFLKEDLVTELCTVTEHYQTDADLMLNISRIFR